MFFHVTSWNSAAWTRTTVILYLVSHWYPQASLQMQTNLYHLCQWNNSEGKAESWRCLWWISTRREWGTPCKWVSQAGNDSRASSETLDSPVSICVLHWVRVFKYRHFSSHSQTWPVSVVNLPLKFGFFVLTLPFQLSSWNYGHIFWKRVVAVNWSIALLGGGCHHHWIPISHGFISCVLLI